MAREPVTSDRITAFLRELGRRYRGTGRLYLVGGSQVILSGIRGHTEDIGYLAELEDHDAFVVAVRSRIRDMHISVEPAHPGDFIPLPGGWRDRSPFIGRFGALDVFSFDPVATALAKIERGTDRDVYDVLALVRLRRVEIPQLSAAFEEIVPRLERESLKLDEHDFRRKLSAFIRMAQSEADSALNSS